MFCWFVFPLVNPLPSTISATVDTVLFNRFVGIWNCPTSHHRTSREYSISPFLYDQGASSVIYRWKMTHGKNEKNFQVFSPLEFIAAITQHIPDPSFQLVRYYGWYSNRMRGDRKKQEGRGKEKQSQANEDDKNISIWNYKPKRIPPLMWRECIKKVWEVDPLVCPKCTGEMKIISFIYKRTVIKKILTVLNFYEEKGNQQAPPMPKEDYTERVEVVPYGDGWPGFEEKVLDVLKKSKPQRDMSFQIVVKLGKESGLLL